MVVAKKKKVEKRTRAPRKGRIIKRTRPTRRLKRDYINAAKRVSGADLMLQVPAKNLPQIATQLGPELLWQTAMARPGTFDVPYVEEGCATGSLRTGIVKGAYSWNANGGAALTGNHSLIALCPVVSSIGYGKTGVSYQYNVNLAASSAANSAALAYSDLYGTIDSFTDKFVTYASTLRLNIRTANAVLAGTAWIGSVPLSALNTAQSSTLLRQRAYKEIDLKAHDSIEIKTVIQNRYAVHGSSATTNTLSDLQDEMFSYILLSPGVARSITDGAEVTYTIDISVVSNFVWWPDGATPALDSIAKPEPVAANTNNRQANLASELDSATPSPFPLSEKEVEEFVPKVVNAVKTGARNKIDWWGHAKRFGKAALVGAIKSLPSLLFKSNHVDDWTYNRKDAIAWLEWCGMKDPSCLRPETLNEDQLMLYEEYETARDTLINAMEVDQKAHETFLDLLSNAPRQETHKRGVSTLLYQFEGEFYTEEDLQRRVKQNANVKLKLLLDPPKLSDESFRPDNSRTSISMEKIKKR